MVKGFTIMMTKMFSTKVNGELMKNTVLEYFIVLNSTTKESGRMVKSKETDTISTSLQKTLTKEASFSTRSMAKVK
jgi:hypothetical protein